MTDVREEVEAAIETMEAIADEIGGEFKHSARAGSLRAHVKYLRAALADDGWRDGRREVPTDEDIENAVETIRRRINAEGETGSLAFQYPNIFIAAAVGENGGKLRAICEDHANAHFSRVLRNIPLPPAGDSDA